ncbi:NLR family CARD domain-containing protein 3-like [Acropora muricata]|uniref:NLR family CARD domain-containing protein 3-like n=1 Tax=Acropora muricata TaxID=159855 RepID=UPI0034E460D3
MEPCKALCFLSKDEQNVEVKRRFMASAVSVNGQSFLLTSSSAIKDKDKQEKLIFKRYSRKHFGRYTVEASFFGEFGEFTFLRIRDTPKDNGEKFDIHRLNLELPPSESLNVLTSPCAMEKLKFKFKCDGNIRKIELSEKSIEETSIVGAPIIVEQSGQFCVIGVVGWTSEETLCPCYWNKSIRDMLSKQMDIQGKKVAAGIKKPVEKARASCPSHVIEGIRQVYLKCEGVIFPVPWCDEFNFQIQDIFTRLRIVKKEKACGQETTNEVTNMTSIFTPHERCKQPLIVLIEGEPGMGKTTYCQKLVFDWANKSCREWDESFPRIDVLLLLRCRGIKSSLWDAVEDQILPDELKSEEKEMFFQFLKENPSKVLLVLDGLDEADPQKLEMFLKLIQRKLLPGCYVILTSRHEVGRKVRPFTDTLLEIVGFTPTDAKCYIRKYFQHAEHLAKALISNVEFDKDLKKLTTNPLNTLLLCVIFEDLKGVLPSNRTQLYVEIVLFVLRRYESKNGVSNRGKDLLLVYKKELMILGETALDSLCKQDLYFDDYGGDIKESLVIKFGFLTIQSGGSKRAPCDRYGFFHKSFQEFFSGYFLAFSAIDDITRSYSVLTDERYMGELLPVLRFMIGVVASRSEETTVSVLQSMASVVNERCHTCDNFVFRFTVANALLNECKTCSGDLYTKLVRTLGESLRLVDVVARPTLDQQNSYFIETFLRALAFNSTVSSLNLFWWKLPTEVTDLLAQALRVNASLSSLDLYRNSIGVQGANSLAQALRVNTSLSSLNLSCNSIGDEGASSLAQGLRENTFLSSLNLSSNAIGDVGANSLDQALRVGNFLSSLNLSSNSIGAEGANSLAQALEVNTSLASLDLSENPIGAEGANSLAQALRVNTTLSSLDLSEDGIGDEGANSLAQALEDNTSLSSLGLSRNSIGAEGANSLVQALRISTSLSSLDLSDNDFATEETNSIAQALTINTSLSFLDFHSFSIDDEGANSLSQALRVNTTLSSLNLHLTFIGDKGANSLAQALRVNTSLSSLDLSRNLGGAEQPKLRSRVQKENTGLSVWDSGFDLIRAEGANYFAQASEVNTDFGLFTNFLPGLGEYPRTPLAVRQNRSLSSFLNVHYNFIGAEGANSLAEALRVNTSLSSLNLHSNSIGDEGAGSLAMALRVNTSLYSLDLSANSICAEGANSLAQALRVNASLSSLDLYRNSIGDEGANSLAQALRVNISLSSLDLSRSSIGVEGANSLAQALRVNTSLSSLDLSRNFIGSQGASALAQALRVNTSLSSLILKDNSIGDEGANSLAEALRGNTSLSFLDLSYNPIDEEIGISLAQALRVNLCLFSLDYLEDSSTLRADADADRLFRKAFPMFHLMDGKPNWYAFLSSFSLSSKRTLMG